MKTDVPSPCAVELCEQLMQVFARLRSAFVEIADRHNLTKAQVLALYTLYSCGDALPMGQAACVLHCDASNVTGIVDRLAAQDLIARQECSHDRRAKLLTITPKGRRLIRQLEAMLPSRLGCTRLNETECRQLSDMLSKLRG